MTLGTLRVYALLDFWAGKRGNWYGDQGMLALEVGVSDATVSRAVRALLEKEYIAVRDAPSGGKYSQEFVVLARILTGDEVFTDEKLITDATVSITHANQPSLLTTQTPMKTSARKPRKREIQDEDIRTLQAQNPDLDIPAFVADYLNWDGSAHHNDKLLGFQNQLRQEWRCNQFRKGGTRKGVGSGPSSRDPEAFISAATAAQSNVHVYRD